MKIPSKGLVYDKVERQLYDMSVYNDDFKDPKSVGINETTGNSKSYYATINADKIVEAYEEGKLQGPLLDIAASIGEEDNPVLMFMKEK